MNYQLVNRLRFHVVLSIGLCAILFGLANNVVAQQSSFGQLRASGSRLQNGSGTARGNLQGQLPGNVSGSARYLRGNRRRGSFIGANTRQRLVGNQQAVAQGRVQTAAETAPPKTNASQSINKRLSLAPAGQMYNPTLSVDFEGTQVDISSLAREVETRVTEKLSLKRGQLAVAILDRTAKLTGTVSSERERRLAEALLTFEPGISRVENLIQLETDNQN